MCADSRWPLAVSIGSGVAERAMWLCLSIRAVHGMEECPELARVDVRAHTCTIDSTVAIIYRYSGTSAVEYR